MSYRDTVIARTPVAYWRLGDRSGATAVDEMGNHPGTYSGSPSLNQDGALTGDEDPAVDFDGTDDYVAIPVASVFSGTAERTYEMWFNATGATQVQALISHGPNNTGERVSITGTSGQVSVAVTGHDWGVSGLSLSGWHHVVVTLPAGSTQSDDWLIYLDGVLQASATIAGAAVALNSGTTNPAIGAALHSPVYYDSAIDEVALYDVALTAEQVKENYRASFHQDWQPGYAETVRRDAPVSYWRLGEDAGTTATDEMGRNDGTYEGPTLGATGALATDDDDAISLDGTTDWVEVPTAGLSQSVWAVEAWIRPDASSAGYVISEEYTGAGDHVSFMLGLTNDVGVEPGQYLNAGIYDGSWTFTSTGQTLTLSEWAHVVATFDGSTIRVYHNGVLVGSVAASAATDAMDLVYIGKKWDAGASESPGIMFDGLIDEAAVYDRALTADEIKEHYLAGLWEGYAREVMADSPEAYWRLGESAGTAFADETEDHDGSWDVAPTLGATGALVNDDDTAVTLDGSTEYGTVAHHADLNPANITLEAWFKPASGGFGDQKAIIQKAYTSHTSPHYQYSLFVVDNASNPKRVGAWLAIGGTGYGIGANNAGWVYDEWHHLVATFDGSTIRLYLNGVQVTSQAQAGSISGYTGDVGIGHYPNLSKNSTFLWDGGLDEIAVYPTAITAARVRRHYQTGLDEKYAAEVSGDGPSAYWRLGESAGTTAEDETGSHDGTYNGSPTLGVAGALADSTDTAVDFDGTDDKMTRAESLITGATDFTIEGWFKWGSGFHILYVQTGSGSQTGNLYFRVKGDGTLALQVNASDVASGSTDISDGAWHHVVAVRSGSAITLYVDGVEDGSGTDSSSITDYSWLGIAHEQRFLGYSNGDQDETSIYLAALTHEQVVAHYIRALEVAGAVVVHQGAGSFITTGQLKGGEGASIVELASDDLEIGLVLAAMLAMDIDPDDPASHDLEAAQVQRVSPTMNTPVIVDGQPT